MHRAVRTAAEAGVRQFLDIGTGIPTEPNLHQVAQRVAPESKVVYADNDPIVLRHAEALLQSSAEGRTDSFLILSQVTQDPSPECVATAAELFRRSGTPFHPRTLPEFYRFFDGLELLGPGVIPVYGWRPDPEDVTAQAEGAVPVYAGVAVKP